MVSIIIILSVVYFGKIPVIILTVTRFIKSQLIFVSNADSV